MGSASRGCRPAADRAHRRRPARWLIGPALAVIVGCALGGGYLAARYNAGLRRVTGTVTALVGDGTGNLAAHVAGGTRQVTLPVPATVRVGDQLPIWLTATGTPSRREGVARDATAGGFLALDGVAVAAVAHKAWSVRRQQRLALGRAADEEASWREIITHLSDIDA